MTSILLLGGTGWLSGEIARQAVAAGHSVTCLTRGRSAVADGAEAVVADRSLPAAYQALTGREFDTVIDVTRDPAQVAGAIGSVKSFGHWVFVSTISAYQDVPAGGLADETSALLSPLYELPDAASASPEEQAAAYGRGKVGCENLVLALGPERTTVVRPGLIAGPGDPSDRFGYWPAAFARAAEAGQRAVLVPDSPELPVQVIDVRDLATFTLDVGTRPVPGIFDVVGAEATMSEVLSGARGLAGHTGELVLADPDLLRSLKVNYWMGPRSLPLWLPPDLMPPRGADRALAAGLRRRPIEQTTSDTLAHERALGLDRDRGAGLTSAEEVALLAELAG